MKVIRALAIVALVLGSARAGTQYEVKCSSKECGFETSIGIGGGMRFEQSSGYCKKCGKVVSVTWKRDSKELPSHLSVWDPMSGVMREIFNCPQCKGPVAVIQHIEELKHCPECGKASLKSKSTMLYD